jgi:hypothetical protein
VQTLEFLNCVLPDKPGESPNFDDSFLCVNPFIDESGKAAALIQIPTQNSLALEGYGKMSVVYVGGIAVIAIAAVAAVKVGAIVAASELVASLPVVTQIAGVTLIYDAATEVKDYLDFHLERAAENVKKASQWGGDERQLSESWDILLADNWGHPSAVHSIAKIRGALQAHFGFVRNPALDLIYP